MRQIEIVSTTGSELITTSDVKDYVRIDTTADDTLIERMISKRGFGAKTTFPAILLQRNGNTIWTLLKGLLKFLLRPLHQLQV